mgnify:CR=1 FL=1
MAFQTTSGYGNLPNGNFSPIIYSKQVQLAFRKSTVVGDITNSDYFGEISGQGDTVRIIKEPTVSISAYTRGAVVTPQDLADDEITLEVDQAQAFAFKVDDIEERQSHVNFEAMATSSGAFSLKRNNQRACFVFFHIFDLFMTRAPPESETAGCRRDVHKFWFSLYKPC